MKNKHFLNSKGNLHGSPRQILFKFYSTVTTKPRSAAPGLIHNTRVAGS